MRKIVYGSKEVREFKARAKHCHTTSAYGVEYWGDGKRVLLLNHAARSGRRTAEIFEKGDTLWDGEGFSYRRFFLSPLKDSEI
jgi:hypothetical protein